MFKAVIVGKKGSGVGCEKRGRCCNSSGSVVSNLCHLWNRNTLVAIHIFLSTLMGEEEEEQEQEEEVRVRGPGGREERRVWSVRHCQKLRKRMKRKRRESKWLWAEMKRIDEE